MESRQRHAAIVRRLQTRGQVGVAELAAELATSEVTVRRDLDELEGIGVLRRVRGGAVNLLHRGQELPFAMRRDEHVEAKDGIARRAAALLDEGEAIVLDGGTTTLALAHHLVGRRLTVMALSLRHAGVLADGGSPPTLLMPGGSVRPGELVLGGPLTESSLAGMRFDTAVLGGCGVSPNGELTTHDMSDAAVMRAAIASSRRTVLLVDAAKFSRTAMVVVASVSDVDVVVTDPAAPVSRIEALRRAGTTVLGDGPGPGE